MGNFIPMKGGWINFDQVVVVQVGDFLLPQDLPAGTRNRAGFTLTMAAGPLILVDWPSAAAMSVIRMLNYDLHEKDRDVVEKALFPNYAAAKPSPAATELHAQGSPVPHPPSSTDRYFQAAHDAGCNLDLIRKLTKAGVILQPDQLTQLGLVDYPAAAPKGGDPC